MLLSMQASGKFTFLRDRLIICLITSSNTSRHSVTNVAVIGSRAQLFYEDLCTSALTSSSVKGLNSGNDSLTDQAKSYLPG